MKELHTGLITLEFISTFVHPYLDSLPFGHYKANLFPRAFVIRSMDIGRNLVFKQIIQGLKND